MTSDALGERAPTEAELDLAYKLACEANCKAAIYWQNYVRTGDHQGIFEPLSKLAIELTKALVRTPPVAGWLIECNCTKEPPLEIGDREFSTAHHAALECVCRVVDGVTSETRPIPDYKFDRRCFIGWNWEKLEKRITREWRRAVEELPDGEQQPPNANGSWLKIGLPPDGWHKTPLCGLLEEIQKWADTTDKTLHSKNGKRWWVTEWTGKDTPYAIYFPTPQQYGDAVSRRNNPKQPKPAGENRRQSERTGAVRVKAKRK